MNHHLKFALREMRKNRLITFGSILSLVLGALCIMFIYLWIHNERSMDHMHSKISRIYMPVSQNSSVDTPDFIAAKMFFGVDYQQFAHVLNSVQTSIYPEERITLTYEDDEHRGRGLVTDSTFFEIFDFELLVGDRINVLHEPNNVVLSETMAQRVFGDEDPLGKTVYIQNDRMGYYQVAAIMEDIASNSSMHFDFIIPRHSQKWWGANSEEFILVDEQFDQAAFEEEFRLMGRKHQQFKESILSLVPFDGLYFDNYFESKLFVKRGNDREVNTLLAVALIILLISAFNYANLQTTQTYSYLKVRGIKQVHGASQKDFWLEIMAARLIQGFLSLLMVALLFELFKPAYLGFLGITQNISSALMIVYMAAALGVLLLVSLVFSVFQITRVATTEALSGQLNSGKQNAAGKTLITLQYVMATSLIIVSVIVFRQFSYMINKDLGYQTDNVLSVNFIDGIAFDFNNQEAMKEQMQRQKQNFQLVNAELSKMAGVIHYTQGDLPTNYGWKMSWKLSRSDYEYSQVSLTSLEPEHIDVFDLKMVKGRFFSDSLDRSRQHKVVINRAAMEYWGIEELGEAKLASSSWDGEEDPWLIIGVVEDFHFEHLSQKVKPLVMTYFHDTEERFVIRIAENRFQETLSELEALFTKINPQRPFDYKLLETELNAQYDREKKLSDIFLLFTLTGLIISSIGLFTFALYETRKRIKEVGIRKVVGASVPQVVRLLSRSLLQWVLVAFLIACPLSWYFMEQWLSNFANQTEMSWWIFVAAGLTVALLGLLTVIWQTMVVARRNPVQALRYD